MEWTGETVAVARSLSFAAFGLFMGEDLLQTRRVQRQVDFRCGDKIDRLTDADIAQCCSHSEQRFLWRVLPLFLFIAVIAKVGPGCFRAKVVLLEHDDMIR